MLDHLAGKPSANWKRSQVLLVLAACALMFSKGRTSRLPQFLQRIDRKLDRFYPWQIVLGTCTLIYLLQNGFLLLGLNAPEPLARLYSRSFYRATWILAALDAGFWTAMSVPGPQFVRDIASILFSGFYLIFADAADEKVRRIRATITVDQMRVSWTKLTNPYLRFFALLSLPKLTVRRELLVQRHTSHSSYSLPPIKVIVLYIGPKENFAHTDKIILHFPGGGFVSMGPNCHEDYLMLWAKQNEGVPIISVDYGKAPEYTYPWALDEGFDLWKAIVGTKGRCIGLEGNKDIKAVFVGDSAGGNLATAITLKILDYNNTINHQQHHDVQISINILPLPVGVILIYPCLEFDLSCWMAPQNLQLMRAESSKSLPALLEAKEHLKHKSPLSVVPDRESRTEMAKRVFAESFGLGMTKVQGSELGDETKAGTGSSIPKEMEYPAKKKEFGSNLMKTMKKRGKLEMKLAMTSRMSFFNDRIISPDLMRAMAILYLGLNSPDFTSDYLLSPIVAPSELLAHFPPVYLICGEKDPLVDDTVVFAGKIRQAKREFLMTENEEDGVTVKILKGTSHAFMQMLALLPESRKAIDTIGGWMRDCLHKESHGLTSEYNGASQFPAHDNESTPLFMKAGSVAHPISSSTSHISPLAPTYLAEKEMMSRRRNVLTRGLISDDIEDDWDEAVGGRG